MGEAVMRLAVNCLGLCCLLSVAALALPARALAMPLSEVNADDPSLGEIPGLELVNTEAGEEVGEIEDVGTSLAETSRKEDIAAKEKGVKAKLTALGQKAVFKDKGENPLKMTVQQLMTKEKGIKDQIKAAAAKAAEAKKSEATQEADKAEKKVEAAKEEKEEIKEKEESGEISKKEAKAEKKKVEKIEKAEAVANVVSSGTSSGTSSGASFILETP